MEAFRNVVTPTQAQASSGEKILETIGVSVAAGTVLGASTLPFYDQPSAHLMNLAYGASAGAVVGLGILLYGVAEGLSQGEPEDGTAAIKDGLRPQASRGARPATGNTSAIRLTANRAASFRIDPTSIWLPVVSLTW